MSTAWKYWTRNSAGDALEHDWSNADDPLPDGALLFKVDFLKQFVELCEDRSLLANGYFQDRFGDTQSIQAGHYMTQARILVDDSLVNIYRLQYAFNSLFFYTHPDECCYVFIPTENSADVIGRSVSIHKTGNEILVECGLPEMRDYDTSAVLGFFTARRTQTHPDDPSFTGFEYGLMQPGDIIGPWIFEDMRRAGARTGMVLKIVDNGFLFFGEIFRASSWTRAAANPFSTWSSSIWYNGGAQQGAQASYYGDPTNWGALCNVASAAWRIGAFDSVNLTGRSLDWDLLSYPVDLGGTHQWNIGATYGIFNLVRSGSIVDVLPVEYDFGTCMDHNIISPPFDSAAPSSASANFENRMAPEVFALRTGTKPNPRGATLLMSVSRT